MLDRTRTQQRKFRRLATTTWAPPAQATEADGRTSRRPRTGARRPPTTPRWRRPRAEVPTDAGRGEVRSRAPPPASASACPDRARTSGRRDWSRRGSAPSPPSRWRPAPSRSPPRRPPRRPRRRARRGRPTDALVGGGHQRIHERIRGTATPGSRAGRDADASVRQPLVLVTHATAPRLRLTRAQASELLREDRDGTTARVLARRAGCPADPAWSSRRPPPRCVRAVRARPRA